jgi:hypothetical protein
VVITLGASGDHKEIDSTVHRPGWQNAVTSMARTALFVMGNP